MCYRPIRKFATNAQILIFSHFRCFLKHEWRCLSPTSSHPPNKLLLAIGGMFRVKVLTARFKQTNKQKGPVNLKEKQINSHYILEVGDAEANLVSVHNIDFVHLEGSKKGGGRFCSMCKKKKKAQFGRWNEKRQRLQEMVDIFC